MSKFKQIKAFNVLAVIILSAFTVSAQLSSPPTKSVGPVRPNRIIFAVLNEGKTLEPIAYIESNTLVNADTGDTNIETLKTFVENYYKPKTFYNLIFGGSVAGKVQVSSSNPNSDCAKNVAEASAETTRTKLKGFIMALATDAPIKKPGSGTRRAPNAAERREIEALVRAEFVKKKIPAANLKTLRNHNLTALDVDNDGSAEFVGSYWVATGKTERALLFFIAGKRASGKYALEYSSFGKYKPKDVMSGDINDLDQGIYHELLLDVFDYNGDGTAEIFTIVQAFEGNNFNVFRRESGKWVKTLEHYNYHCAY